MKKTGAWLSGLVAGLLLAALACTAAGNGTLTPPPATVANQPASPVAADELLSLRRVSETLDALNSYRMRLEFRFRPLADTAAQTMIADLAFMAEPAAASVTMQFTGLDENQAADRVTLTQIGDQTFMALPDIGCLRDDRDGAAIADNPFADLANPDTYLSDLTQARRQPDTVVNDTAVRHYSFDHTSLSAPAGQFTALEGHIYIAQAGNYLVRLTMDGRGQGLSAWGATEEGEWSLLVDVHDVNQPLLITLPAGCEATDAAGYPLLDDARDVVSLGGFYSYRTARPLAEVVAFYQVEMVNAGWTPGEEELLLENVAFMNFSRAGVSVAVTISRERDSNDVLVLIMTN